ncbi:unnamed protein product [Orchesella dallaii]|uniref:Uncharacterized protein n=1 Tax=Orchesella dallaii TaxID=48710 RepID=A0ABP1RK37_9HEXA
MANKITITALKLHEKLSSHHAPPHIIYWDSSTTTSGGKYSTYPQRSATLIPWFISNLLVFLLIFVCAAKFLDLLLSPWGAHIPIIEMGYWFSATLLGVFVFGINTVFFNHADEYAESLNGLIQFGKEIAINIPKSKRKNHIDKCIGMLALWTAVTLNIIPFLVLIYQWLEGYDLSLWILKLVFGNNFEESLWLPFRVVLYIGRVAINLVWLTELYRTICVMCLIMILEPPIFFLCLEEFDKESLDYPVLKKYWKLCRIRNVNVKPCGQITGVSMGFCFVLTTITHVACILYWDRLSGLMLGYFIGVTVVMDSMLYTALPWVTKLYDMSNTLIEKWRKENAGWSRQGTKRRHFGMLLKATKPIAFKAGNVGVLKEETKRRYFESVLSAFCDVALALKG